MPQRVDISYHRIRLTNYVGIISQGLRIAPPEAPVSGYRFGKGGVCVCGIPHISFQQFNHPQFILLTLPP